MITIPRKRLSSGTDEHYRICVRPANVPGQPRGVLAASAATVELNQAATRQLFVIASTASASTQAILNGRELSGKRALHRHTPVPS